MIIKPCEEEWVTVTKTVSVIVEEPSDGLLPVSTQMALPGCLKKVELLHMNHEEVTKDPYARDQLNKVFTGEISTSTDRLFFKLNNK